jgi:hypothetical protein
MEGKRKTFGIGVCKVCKHSFIKKAPNQTCCEEDSYWRRYEGGSVMKALFAAEKQFKKGADQSGNPKVWTAKEYSQDFLKSLISQR